METLNYIDSMNALEILPSNAGSNGVTELIRALLFEVGEDPDREGLQKTPDRVARMATELLSGYTADLVQLVNGAIFESNYRDIIWVRDIEYYSLCEHHLLPFYGRAHVAYIPDGKIIGLSKIPRLVEMFARRLQVQERLTTQIAETLDEILKPKGVGVVVEGTHLCARMRGVKNEAEMVTRSLLGVFDEDETVRREFMELMPVTGR